jgi:hypothetical protein
MNSAFPDWQTILALQGGAAATLTGLVFVAVSLNLARIMTVPGLPGRAAESILQLMQVFFVATAILVPGQPVWLMGVELLAVAVASWIAQTSAQVRYAKTRRGHPWSWLIPRVALTQFATIPFAVAGIGLWLGNVDFIYWTVPGFVFSFTAAMMSAWVLLIEILR